MKIKPLPLCKACLICDLVIHDRFTEKVSVVNIHTGFSANHFPAAVGQGYIYLQMTNGIGSYQLSLDVIDLDDGSRVWRKVINAVRFDTRDQIVNYFHSLSGLYLPHPGRYDLIVLADLQELDRQQFAATPPKGS